MFIAHDETTWKSENMDEEEKKKKRFGTEEKR